jgi:uncharacterized protein (DUF736 family)
MAQEQRPGQGILFRNDKGGNSSRPDYRGTLTTPDGTKWDLAAWTKTARNGSEFFSISVKEPRPQDDRRQGGDRRNDDDSTPF